MMNRITLLENKANKMSNIVGKGEKKSERELNKELR
jgi:hypothetical protein